MDIALDKMELNLYDADLSSRIYSEDHYSFPQYIGKEASVTRSIVTQGAVVLGKIDSCVVSSHVFIDLDAKCTRCVIMEGARINKGAVVHNAIIAPHVVIDENAQINVDGEKIVLIDSRWRG